MANPKPKDLNLAKVQSYLEDPFSYKEMYGKFKSSRETGDSLGYGWLKEISKISIMRAFIKTRLGQVSSFAHKQMRRVLPGYKIVLADPDAQLKPWDHILIKRVENWLETCGDWDAVDISKAEIYVKGLNFSKFLKLILQDSLIYDQAAFEILRDSKGRPVAFLPIAGDTIRINIENNGFVQVIQSIPKVEYGIDEIGWCIRNPRTDLNALGYGYPEFEELIDVLTAYLFGFEYNSKIFTQGGLASGIVHIAGAIPDKKLDEFREDLFSMVSGIENAHRWAILNDPSEKAGVKVERLDDRERDMQYREWLNFLIKIMGAIFQMDPSEIGFNYGTEGSQAPIFQSNAESRVELGHDKGLRPLLRDAEEWINQYLITPRWPELKFVFAGLSDEEDDKRIERHLKEIKYYKTINEIRAEEDLPPITAGYGGLVLNPTIMQAVQFAMMRGKDPFDFLGINQEQPKAEEEPEGDNELPEYSSTEPSEENEEYEEPEEREEGEEREEEKEEVGGEGGETTENEKVGSFLMALMNLVKDNADFTPEMTQAVQSLLIHNNPKEALEVATRILQKINNGKNE